MPKVPGVDTALLAKVILDTEASWSPNQASIETADIQAKTLEALVANQIPKEQGFIQKITDPEKDHDVKVYWPDFCGLEAADTDTNVCNAISRTMAEVNEKAYTIGSIIEDGFAIEEDKLATSAIDKAKFIKQSSDAAIKRIIERLSTKGVAFLNGNSGYNNGGGNSGYSFANGATEVPTNDYNVSLMPKIMYDMIVNRVPNAFLIDGGSLYLPYTNARLNAANGEGKGDANRAQLFPAEFDILGFGKAALSDRTFVVAPYSYALVTKNYVPNAAPVFDEQLGATGMMKYQMRIPRYGIVLDVFMERACVNGTKQRYKINWLYKLHYDYLVNPAGCTVSGNTVTGIWQYKKV